MFKEGRRGVSVHGVGRITGRIGALIGVWLFLPVEQLAAEDATKPAEPAEVAVATDMDEPAQFVPHEEQALDLDLDFAAGNPFKDNEGVPRGDALQPQGQQGMPTLAKPPTAGSDQSILNQGLDTSHQAEGLGPAEGEVTGADRDAAQKLMERVHTLAKAAATDDDYAAVIDLCTESEASTQWESGRRYFRRLASWAHNRRGEASVQEGRAADALANFDKALQLDPENWRAAHNRGVSRAEKGELATAVADFSYVIQLKEDYGPAYRNRAEVLFATGQYVSAIDDYTRALAYMSETAELHYLRASALHRMGRVREALADYDASLQGGEESADRYIGRAGAHADLSDFAAAIADLDKAIKLDPQSAEAYRAVGWILATCPNARYRRPDKALLAARHALELQGKTDPAYFDTLAAALAAADDFEQAVTIQDYAIRLASGREEKEVLRTRLALYQKNRPYLSGTDVSEVPLDELGDVTPAAANRSAGQSGLRQPQRLAAPRQ